MRHVWLVAAMTLALAVVLGGCSEPEPEQATTDLEAMKQAVNDELRTMAAALTGAGLSVDRARGRVVSGGMSTQQSEDYQASAVLAGEGSEADQVDQAATALESEGWSRTGEDLDAAEPWVQLKRADFLTTISWAKVGERDLVLSLDQLGEVEVPEGTDPVDRNNSEEISLN